MLIKDLPKEIQELVEKRRTDKHAKNLGSAFVWGDTPENHNFWDKIDGGNFTEFYKLYPKESEYKGCIKGFPKEVVEKMLERQVEQGNPRDIYVFIDRIGAEKMTGGFDWEDTVEGWKFWKDIYNRNFDIFFEKYPKTENKIIDKHLKTKQNEKSRLSEQESGNIRKGSSIISSRTRQITNGKRFVGNQTRSSVGRTRINSIKICSNTISRENY